MLTTELQEHRQVEALLWLLANLSLLVASQELGEDAFIFLLAPCKDFCDLGLTEKLLDCFFLPLFDLFLILLVLRVILLFVILLDLGFNFSFLLGFQFLPELLVLEVLLALEVILQLLFLL